jgi:hypothetical protein
MSLIFVSGIASRIQCPNASYDVGAGRGSEEGMEGMKEMEAIPGFILYDADACNGVDVRCGDVQGSQKSNACP